MARLQFMDLSVDIKSLIVQHINRPTDLRSLCLTNKHLHSITIRELYADVTLDIGSSADVRLAPFLSPKNAGLKHLRKLNLYMAEVPDKCNQTPMAQTQMANLAIGLILEFLPEDGLEKFSWHPWVPFSGKNLVLLYKKQKRMKWLEAISLDSNVLHEIQQIPNFSQVFQNVRKLGLYPDSQEVLEFCHMLVKNSPKVTKLTLHAYFDEHDPPIPTRELNDSSTGPGRLTSTVFSHLQPFAKCTPLALTELTLQKIALRYSAGTYCTFIDFPAVKSLRVFACTGTDALFAELSRSTKLPNKLETLEIKLDDNEEQDGLAALDGFLCLVSGIRTLTLDITNAKTMPAAAGIVRHSKTLKSLNVHANRIPDDCEDELVYDYASFADICKNCKGLEQISVGFPDVSVIREKNTSFVDFENCLGELPELVTLNITTWPTSGPKNSHSSSRLPRKIYDHLLRGMAQQGFERSVDHATQHQRSSKLAIIAFGSSDKVWDRDDSLNQIIFVKGTQVDLLGNKKAMAIQMSWCLRRYTDAGPKSDILNFALSRTTRPPTRDPPISDDSDF